MTINYVNLTLDFHDPSGNLLRGGIVAFTPSAELLDTTDHQDIPAAVYASLPGLDTASPTATVVKLVATDNASIAPSGWAYNVTFSGVSGNPATRSVFVAFSNGGNQYFSSLSTAVNPTQFQSYIPLSELGAANGAAMLDANQRLVPAERDNVWPTVLTAAVASPSSGTMYCFNVGSNITQNLPQAPAVGTTIGFKRVDSSPAFSFVVVPQGSDVIATGSPSAIWPGQSVTYVYGSDTAWHEIAGYTPALMQVATLGTAGFALQNGTPAILSWTAPNDGNAHTVMAAGNLHVSSAETGGIINLNYTDPGGNAGAAQLDGGGHGVSTVSFSAKSIIVGPGATVTLTQTALTLGAATVWATLWAV